MFPAEHRTTLTIIVIAPDLAIISPPPALLEDVPSRLTLGEFFMLMRRLLCAVFLQ